MNKTFLSVLLCAVFATYIEALPLNALKESKAAFVSNMEDDLEPAETRHHFKKNQVYAQPQAAPIYAQAQPVAVYSQPQPVAVYSQPQPVAVYSQPQPVAVYSHPQPAAVYSQPQPAAIYSQPQPVASHPVYSAVVPAHSAGGYQEHAGYGGQSYGSSWGGSYGGGTSYGGLGGYKSKHG